MPNLPSRNLTKVRRREICPLEKYSSRRFRRGQWVQIRSEDEIRATLDAEGKLDGLPFMPEMVKYCGRRFRIFRRAERVFLDHHYYVVGLKNTVLLDDLRCDGSAHGGCQMKCLMFWKEAWLRPSDPPTAEENISAPPELISLTNNRNITPAKVGEKFSCQATELAQDRQAASGWDLRQYLWDVLNGDRTVRHVVKILSKQTLKKLERLLPHHSMPIQTSGLPKPAGASLNLQPGEWVEVKSLAEINETLSTDSRLRGLGFSPDMIPFCGKKFSVILPRRADDPGMDRRNEENSRYRSPGRRALRRKFLPRMSAKLLFPLARRLAETRGGGLLTNIQLSPFEFASAPCPPFSARYAAKPLPSKAASSCHFAVNRAK